jgi:hypothetical protein
MEADAANEGTGLFKSIGSREDRRKHMEADTAIEETYTRFFMDLDYLEIDSRVEHVRTYHDPNTFECLEGKKEIDEVNQVVQDLLDHRRIDISCPDLVREAATFAKRLIVQGFMDNRFVRAMSDPLNTTRRHADVRMHIGSDFTPHGFGFSEFSVLVRSDTGYRCSFCGREEEGYKYTVWDISEMRHKGITVPPAPMYERRTCRTCKHEHERFVMNGGIILHGTGIETYSVELCGSDGPHWSVHT